MDTGGALNGSDQEEQFRVTMTELASEVLDPGDRRVYDIIVDNSNRFHEFFDCVHGGARHTSCGRMSPISSATRSARDRSSSAAKSGRRRRRNG